MVWIKTNNYQRKYVETDKLPDIGDYVKVLKHNNKSLVGKFYKIESKQSAGDTIIYDLENSNGCGSPYEDSRGSLLKTYQPLTIIKFKDLYFTEFESDSLEKNNFVIIIEKSKIVKEIEIGQISTIINKEEKTIEVETSTKIKKILTKSEYKLLKAIEPLKIKENYFKNIVKINKIKRELNLV